MPIGAKKVAHHGSVVVKLIIEPPVQEIQCVSRNGRADRWPLDIVCIGCKLQHGYMNRVNYTGIESDCPGCGQRGRFV